MSIQLKEITKDDRMILANLLEYYVYDFSPFLKIDVNDDGKFGFEDLDVFFNDEVFAPYFIKYENQLAGFAIVKKVEHHEFDYSIDQFFVLKRYNGKGIGKEAAFQIFNRYRGRWQVTQVEKNYPAQAFWRSVIKSYTNNKFKEHYDEGRRSVQRFHNH